MRELLRVLTENRLGHHRLKPHCPEENGTMERAFRTLREALRLQARDVLARVVRWYNEQRLHRAWGYLPPVVYYQGNPQAWPDERRRKMAEARHRRKETNLALRQRTIPDSAEEPVASP